MIHTGRSMQPSRAHSPDDAALRYMQDASASLEINHNLANAIGKVSSKGRIPPPRQSSFSRDMRTRLPKLTASACDGAASFLKTSPTKTGFVPDRDPSEVKKNRRRRKVRFSLINNRLLTYDSLDVPQNEIWWTADEMRQNHADARTAGYNEPLLREYLHAYTDSYQHISSNRKVPVETVQALVQGMEAGYRGMEVYTSLEREAKKNQTREVVQSIVKVYQRVKQHQTADVARILCAHARALTSKSRHWAEAMGKADMRAAAVVDSNGNL